VYTIFVLAALIALQLQTQRDALVGTWEIKLTKDCRSQYQFHQNGTYKFVFLQSLRGVNFSGPCARDVGTYIVRDSVLVLAAQRSETYGFRSHKWASKIYSPPRRSQMKIALKGDKLWIGNDQSKGPYTKVK